MVDGSLGTSWVGDGSDPHYVNVRFPQDVTVSELQLFGNRTNGIFDFQMKKARFELFSATDTQLFDSGIVDLQGPYFDARMPVGRITGVRWARVTDHSAVVNSTFAELKIIGSAVIQRERKPDANLAQLLATVARGSSSGAINPAAAIDQNVDTNWYAASHSPGEYIELAFPVETTVTGIKARGPTRSPDGFNSSDGIDCMGRFTLVGAGGNTLFDSGGVNFPRRDLQSSEVFEVAVPAVGGVRSMRYTDVRGGCGKYPIGFADIQVLGTASLTAPPFSMATRLHGLVRREVHSTPLVANMSDDNGDGRIDARDIPDIVVPVESHSSQLRGEILVISGDDGRELATLGGPDLVSPWSEAAIADIDGDGRPDVVAVHSDGNHLIAFEATGAVKWISDTNPMPFYMIGEQKLVTGAVAIANLDGVGGPEIVVGASVFSSTGKLLGDGRALGGTFGGQNKRSAISVVADVDLDGKPELIAGPTAYRLTNGVLTKIWQRTDRPDGFAAIGNFDDDPYAEIVIVANGQIYMLNHDGTDAEVWNPPTHAPMPLPDGSDGGAPTIADVDGDGIPEIGVAGRTAYTVFNRDGSVRWQSPISDWSSNSTGSTVFDLDGDGEVEVIYRDELFLRVYRGRDGVLLAKMPIHSTTWTEQPVVVDLDNDGHAEIVVASNGGFVDNGFGTRTNETGVYVLQDIANQWTRTRRIWNQHSYHVTNINEDGSVPTVESPHWLVGGLNNFRLNAFVPGETPDQSDSFTYRASDGTSTSNTATVRITVRTPNSPPSFTSTPVVTGSGGVQYVYVARAADPDATDVLTYSLPTAPPGMTINVQSGRIQWTPTSGQSGRFNVVIKVADPRGLFALQSFAIEVGSAITVPNVVGQSQAAATAAITGANLVVGSVTTQHSAVVPAGNVISQSPAAGTLVASGAAVSLFVSLGPAPMAAVPNVVGQQQTAAQTSITSAGFTVGTVSPQPSLTVPFGNVLSQNPAAGTTAALGSTINLIVSSGPPPTDVDADGDGYTTAAGDCDDTNAAIHPGAIDIPGNGIDEDCNGRDAVPGDTTPPTGAFASPAEDATITQPTDIVGTVNDANFLRYKLELAPTDADQFTTIGSGTSAIDNGVLGRLDPTLLENGLYRVRLTVEDVNGQVTTTERPYRVDGQMKIGNFRISFNDLTIPVAGIPITIVRTYDSRVKTKEDFGIGWTLDIKRGRYQHNRTPGIGWQILPGQLGLPCRNVSETVSHYTEVRLSDYEWYRFALTLSNLASITGGCTATAGFRFVDGRYPEATLQILDGTDILYMNGDAEVLDPNSLLPYNPARVRLTTADGRIVDFDRGVGVVLIEDPNGNALSFGSNGITHSSGRSVAFARDDQGRITQITDPLDRHLVYAYDVSGDLRSFTDQAGNTTTFTYDTRHNLLEIHDPLGRRPLQNEYDADGRLIAVIDANGKRMAVKHELDVREEIVTDRLGKITVLGYDDRGNVVSRTDPLDNTTITTFDARDNKLTERDPLGHASAFTYDASSNVLTETDALGRTTTYTYNTRNQTLSRTDPRGGVTSYTYDKAGNLLTEQDPLGKVTTHTYDTRGSRLTTTDALGRVWTYEYDGAGNRTKTIDPLGVATTRAFDPNGNVLTEVTTRTLDSTPQIVQRSYGYDALNRRIRETDPEGATTQTSYSATGRIESTTDPLGRATVNSYEDQDRLVTVTYPDATKESMTYDAEGRKTTQVDRAGHTTQFRYDDAGRRAETIYADGSTVLAAYDAAARVTSTTDERGNTTAYGYDAANHRVRVTDALNHSVHFTYDANGSVSTIQDPLGKSYGFVYDATNRRTRVDFPDGTTRSSAYDALGRVTSETDQAGKTTQYGYDARGRLASVTDALGQVTRYAYDEIGSLVSQTDAAGKTTAFQADRRGLVTARILPLGQSETFGYDLARNRVSRTDFNEKTTAYGYDALNRLVRRTPDPSLGESQITFTYTPNGRRATMVDGSGTTTYSYDERDRVLSAATPQGTLSYTYDARGNLLRVRSFNANGMAVDYAYDAANRLISATDNRLSPGVTTYEYDAAGNVVANTAPNGVKTSYSYDEVNRLVDVAIGRGATTLGSFAYELGPAGNRVGVTELGGRRVTYGYDAIYRLTAETIASDSLPANNGTIGYTYDAVGNRLTRASSVAPVPSTTYTYDANDRLTSHTYDANGNTIAADGHMFAYDFEDRIKSVDSGAIGFVYDGDGNRVAKTIGGVTTRYLVDQRNLTRYAQVVEELVGGTVQRVYAYGLDLLSQRGAEGATFYGYDGHGSVRLLTNASGTPVDSYRYDAFGNELQVASGAPNLYRYAGEQVDPDLGLQYLRARYMDPRNGRFRTMDKYLGNLAGPMTLHRYLYGNASPMNNIDPSGYETLISIGVASSIVNILVGLALAPVVLYEGFHVAAAGLALVGLVRSSPLSRAKDVQAVENAKALISSNVQFQKQLTEQLQSLWYTPVPWLLSAAGLAGGFQNFGMWICGDDPQDTTVDAQGTTVAGRVCTGIAQAALGILQHPVAAGRVQGVVAVDVKTRQPTIASLRLPDHDALVITTVTGSMIVLDYHATLDPTRPEVKSYADWCQGGCVSQ